MGVSDFRILEAILCLHLVRERIKDECSFCLLPQKRGKSEHQKWENCAKIGFCLLAFANRFFGGFFLCFFVPILLFLPCFGLEAPKTPLRKIFVCKNDKFARLIVTYKCSAEFLEKSSSFRQYAPLCCKPDCLAGPQWEKPHPGNWGKNGQKWPFCYFLETLTSLNKRTWNLKTWTVSTSSINPFWGQEAQKGRNTNCLS